MANESWADDLATCETVMDVVITIYFWAGVREEGGHAFRRAAEARILEITAEKAKREAIARRLEHAAILLGGQWALTHDVDCVRRWENKKGNEVEVAVRDYVYITVTRKGKSRQVRLRLQAFDVMQGYHEMYNIVQNMVIELHEDEASNGNT
jgi:hypothetical protein